MGELDNTNTTRPPIGLTPTSIWLAQRREDIFDAMERYSEANKPIPSEWISELRLSR